MCSCLTSNVNDGKRYVRARWPTVYGEKGRFNTELNGLSFGIVLVNYSWNIVESDYT